MNFKTLLSGIFFFFFAGLNLLSANDDPCTATEILVNTSCISTTFSNATATNTVSVPDPGCAGYNGGDLWFTFTMPNYGYHTVLELAAGSMTDGGMAVYSGADCSALTLVSCDDNSGSGNMPSITVEDGWNFEYAGATFWVRVWENGNDNNGTFDICAYASAANVPSGVTACGSNLIAGNACCDAILLGEELNGYCGTTTGYNDMPDEIPGTCDFFINNNAWVAFIASETTVEISIASSNCSGPGPLGGLQAGIFETSDCINFTLVADDCWNPTFPNSSGSIIASGLVVGETYYIMIDGFGGDECDYTLGIVNGVETVAVSVDDDQICQGESTQLHADVIGSGTYTYNWSPAGSLDDPTSANPIATPSISTDYTVTITGITDNIHTVSVTVYPSAPAQPTVTGATSICENAIGTVYTSPVANTSSYNWTVTGSATIVGGNGLDTILVDWGVSGGAVCLVAENNCGMSPQECITVVTTGQPIITATDPPHGCAPDPFDLNTIVISNAGSGGGLPTYYDNLNDAVNGVNDIFPPTTTVSGIYYIRVASGPDCYDVDSAEVVIEDPALVVVAPGVRCSPDSIDLDNVVINEVNNYPGGTKTYYSDSLDAVNANSPLTSTQVYTGGTYWVRYDTPGGCYEVAPIEVKIDITPDITINQPAPLCPGGAIDLDTISFVDANGATFTKFFYDNLMFATWDILPLTNTVVSMPQTYYLRAETENNCFQIVEIIITAGVIPDGTITGGGTFCQGENTDIVFTLNGSGPFDVVYTDGTTSFTLNGIFDNHIETITVNTDSTFSLVSVTDANGCSGNLLGSDVNIVASSAPTAQISGDASLCDSGFVDIDFTFTGTGPFDAEYTDGVNTYNLSGVNFTHTVSHTITSDTTFTLVSVTDGGACSGTVSGSAVITVYPLLQITNIVESCDASFTMYTVSFEIAGGDSGTYNVSGGPGTLSGNIFTSDLIASGTSYNFNITDNSGCPVQTVTGSQNCSCSTDAGQMNINTIEVCENETATATFLTGSNTLNPGDLFEYVLHDNANAILGTEIARSSTPDFSFQMGMTYGTTYYISPIAGPDNGSGNVDVNHVCFSIGIGTPVIFHELPVAIISGTTTICEGGSTDLTFNFTAGTGPFDIIVTGEGSPVVLGNISDGDTYTISPTSTTTYSLTFVEDNTGAQCTGTFSGNAVVTVLETIQISNIIESCDASFTMYTVSFEITGGNPSNYSVTGDPGTISGNLFTSDPIASGTAYSFNVSDNSGCPDQTITGVNNCNCTTDAGQMDLTSIDACEDETAIASFITGSNTLNTGDIFQYVLHDNAGATLGNWIEISDVPEFSFQAGMSLGITYYISPIAGPNDGTNNVDLNHLCFSIAAGTPVIFYERPEASISGDADLCTGNNANLIFNFSAGVAPFEVVILDGNTNEEITIDNLLDGDTYSTSPSVTTIYTIVNVTDNSPASCTGNGTGSATLTVHQPPIASNIQFICNNTNTQYQVSFEISGGDPASYSVSGDPGTLDNVNNIFTSNFIDNGTPYNFLIDDINNCGPIDISGNYVCDCTSNAGEMELPLIQACESEIASAQHIASEVNLDGNDVLGYILYDQNNPLPGSVMLMSSTPDFSYDSSLAFGVTYHISAVVADDSGNGFPVLDSFIDPCLSVSNGQPIVFIEEPEASIQGDNTICQGDSTDIIFNLIGTGPFNVSYNGEAGNEMITEILDGHIMRVAPTVTTTYTLMTVGLSTAPFCGGNIDPSNNAVTVNVIEIPVVSNVSADCNQLGTSFTVSFEITGGNAALYNVSGDAGTLTGNVFTSDLIVSGSTYNFQIDDGSGCPPVVLTATEYCNCTPDIKPVISLNQDISCNGESDGVLAVSNENGLAPFNFEWSNGTFGEETEGLIAGWHFVTMTDGNNCTSIDSFFLEEPEPIQAEAVITPLTCFNDDDAVISFEDVQGGTGEYTYSIDYYTSFTVNSFYNLPSGTYVGTIEDTDGCLWEDTIEIFNPTEFVVNIGEDVIVELGDSIRVNPISSLPVSSFTWRPDNFLECPDCWDQLIYPTESIVYTLNAETEEGCTASDQLSITVVKERSLFIPNIFSPNGDGNNDIFRVYSGDGVEQINDFRIFDRWGALVYEAKNLSPEVEDFGWDGRLKGREMTQGIYVYFLEVVYIDGKSEIIRGDVTLMR